MELIDIIIYAVIGVAVAAPIYRDSNSLPAQIMLGVIGMSAIKWFGGFETAVLAGLGVIIGLIYHLHYKQGGE